MTDRTDRMVAEAKIERINELDEKADELLRELDKTIERMDELEEEVSELIGE